MPTQKQIRWSQLRVGLTVVFASVTLGVLILLMSGTAGLFAHKIYLHSYFDNAGGLRIGAPVLLQGVDIGNVTDIRVVPNRTLDPVEVTMKVNTKYIQNLRRDSTVTLATAGVLGETFVDISSTKAKGPQVTGGETLPAQDQPDIQDVVKSTQSTLDNLNILLHRLDNIVRFVESGEGSVGRFIKDDQLYKQFSQAVGQFNQIIGSISKGEGTVGKLLKDDELYRKVDSAVNRLNTIMNDLEAGKGTAGKFLKDPALYDQAHQTITKVNRMMDDVNAGRGTLGKLTKDEALAKKIESTINRLDNIVARLEAGEGSAGRLLQDPSLYTNADQMLVETRNLVKAIRENPKKYLTIHFKIF